MSKSNISRIELGELAIEASNITLFDAALKADGMLAELWSFVMAGDNSAALFTSQEEKASRILQFDNRVFPGLLQPSCDDLGSPSASPPTSASTPPAEPTTLVGTLGTGLFDSDVAGDLLDELSGQDPRRRRETLERAFQHALEHRDDLNRAVAALVRSSRQSRSWQLVFQAARPC